MNDSTDNNNDKPQFLSAASPGNRLRHAREAAGLSRGEIALHMRLSERKIQALEEDNYDLFPSETFVSGYLRSYAKVLGLPESDFVRPVSSTKLPPVLSSNAAKNKQVSSMDLPVRMVTYAIVVVVIASLAMWWNSQREKGEIKPTEQQNIAQDAAVAQVEQDATKPLPVEEAETTQTDPVVTESDMAAAPGADPTAAMDDVTPQTAGAGVAPKPEPMPESAKNPEPVEPVQDPAAPPTLMPPTVKVGQPLTAMAEKEGSTLPLTDDIPSSKVVLEYQDDSWTEVTDNAGRQLVYGLMRAGQTIEIRGEAPFKVFLGYAEGVTLYYNSQLFDHTAFHRGEVARFRVGRAEHNQLGSR